MTTETTSTSPLRVGVIGVGWAGQQHIDAYAMAPGVELVAIAGMEEEVLAELGARYGVSGLYRDWQDLVALDGLDAVSVAVPTFLHAPIAVAALERGLHVLSEKPIARTGEEAQSMVDAARAAGRVLDVAFNHRQRGDIRKLKELVDAGRLGTPYYTKAYWLRRSGIPMIGSWFTRFETAGGGPLADIGVHVLDYSLHLLGNPAVETVTASTYNHLGSAGFGSAGVKSGAADTTTFEVEDLASVFLRLEGGGTLLIESSWAAHRTNSDEFGITMYGTDGGAELRVENYIESGELRLFTDDAGTPSETRLYAAPGRGHAAVVDQFLDAIRSGDWTSVDGSSATKLARIIDAAYLSARERREIRLTD
ncbi:putative dehydrogenase [Diaminobutyricimonas aerilata]|uniref:Putative dehydrogenase n=1 Tax=Diaminobutyricimonas aerilata TaxID=1162967 RepID=A0A2M9CF79_9MICO|nr:Gfo/Idh/MocA family oxidoreductase [Diaminobutyricimonas aerilata]PJJ70512.1 putative dehydrogenase [Diaminobutyricimonas aerilata]